MQHPVRLERPPRPFAGAAAALICAASLLTFPATAPLFAQTLSGPASGGLAVGPASGVAAAGLSATAPSAGALAPKLSAGLTLPAPAPALPRTRAWAPAAAPVRAAPRADAPAASLWRMARSMRAWTPAKSQSPIPPPPEKPLAPGKDILPKFSDNGRVSLILSIIEAVYYGRPLPFPWKDGSVFTNVQRVLPPKPENYYREYTLLPPPGSPMTVTVGDRTFRISPPQGHRGAERIIIGGGEIVYYTPDHYKTFIELQIVR